MKRILLTAALVFAAFSLNAQNLVVNSGFDEEIDSKTYYKEQSDIEGWYIFDKTQGATTMEVVEVDAEHGKALKITSTDNNTWYHSHIAQKVTPETLGTYTLSFDAKAEKGVVRVRAFVYDVVQDGWFAIKKNFNIDNQATKKTSAAAYTADCNAKAWKNFKFDFDLTKLVNEFNSVGGVEAAGKEVSVEPADAELSEGYIICIQLANKEQSAYIDNVSFVKK